MKLVTVLTVLVLGAHAAPFPPIESLDTADSTQLFTRTESLDAANSPIGVVTPEKGPKAREEEVGNHPTRSEDLVSRADESSTDAISGGLKGPHRSREPQGPPPPPPQAAGLRGGPGGRPKPPRDVEDLEARQTGQTA